MTARRLWLLCWLPLGVLAGSVAVPSASSDEQRPAVQVTPGKTRSFRAAVQLFADRALPVNPQRSSDLRTAIGEGLEFSSVLLPLDPKAFLGPESTTALTDGPRLDCPDWTQSGADALVEGEIRTDGADLVVEFAVWDTARCVQLDRQTLERPRAQGRRLARAVADQIVKAFTGTQGVADTEIAFISNRSGQREVYVMDADGERPRPATRSNSIKAFPAWLPDREAILYTAHSGDGTPDLFITSRGGLDPGQFLRKILPGRPKYRGVFDPKGGDLALVSSDNDSAELYRVRRDGRKMQRLTTNPAIDISPAWSPDGEWIAFVSDRSGAPHIYVMDRDGRDVRRLTYEGTYNTSPAWSPDGRWIAYETRLEGQFDIWLIDPAGEVNIPLVQHRRSDESPSWSPDGRKLVFSSTRRGRADLYMMDVSGDNLLRLTSGEGDNTQPAWGPFSRR